MANRPYIDQMEVDGEIYDIREANGTPSVNGYGGADLSEELTAKQFHDAIAAQDFSKIHIGDYFPIKLNGSYKDFAKFTVPSGVEYFSDAALGSSAGTTAAAYQGTYQSDTAISFSLGGTTYYAKIGDCEKGFTQTMNAAFKMEVGAINPYLNHGDAAFTAPHVLLCSRDAAPPTLQMRCSNAVWHNTAATNPWLGSALYATLNDPTDGIIKLVEATELGPYIFGGPNGKGMRALVETMAAGAASPTQWSWQDRGKLFLPTEREVYGAAVWQASAWTAGNLYNQWPIFAGSARHIIKGAGDGGGRCHWWLSPASSAAGFCYVTNGGGAGSYSAANAAIRAPLCFLVT